MADRSGLLMTYTTFHIGAYLTLGVGTAALMKQFDLPLLILPFVGFVIAGVAGGVIGSNLPDYEKFEDFENVDLGFWGWKPFKYKMWSHIEHGAFWLALLAGAAIVLLYLPGATKLASESSSPACFT
jgi:hypothetical protein